MNELRALLLGWMALLASVAPGVGQEPDASQSRLQVSDFKLVGGIRLPQPFSCGGLAIDFERGLIYQGGHAQKNNVIEYELPAVGSGANVNSWPIAKRLREVPKFWSEQPWKGMGLEPMGLSIHDGKLWVSPRVYYNQGQGAENDIYLFSESGDEIHVQLPRAKFGGGFIKGHPEWLIGNGGYRSGQGSCAGPTAARIDGSILLDQVNFGSLEFNKRTPRPSGYWPVTPKDTWVAMMPRDPETGERLTKEQAEKGEGIGAWASDTLIGGGVWHPRGLCYWAKLGMGGLDYKFQSEQFAAKDEKGVSLSRPFMYTYDPDTFAWESVKFEAWPYGQVHGCEVGPDGRIYLLHRHAWKSGMYVVDSAIYVFEVAK